MGSWKDRSSIDPDGNCGRLLHLRRFNATMYPLSCPVLSAKQPEHISRRHYTYLSCRLLACLFDIDGYPDMVTCDLTRLS